MHTLKKPNIGLLIIMSVLNLLAALLCDYPVLAAPAAPSAPSEDQVDEEIYLRAREAFNEERFREAERLYERVIREDRDHETTALSHYWRAFALYRLGEVSDLKAAAQLLERQRQRFPEEARSREAERLRQRVERALARAGDARATRRVVIIDDDDHENDTKLAALNALLMMDPDKAVPVLRKLVADKRPEQAELREHALMMITQVDRDAAEDILLEVVATDEDPEFVAWAIFWLAQTSGDRAFDAIEQAFRNHDDEDVREAALFALGQHGGDRAVRLLESIATDSTVSSDIRSQALFSLAQSGADNLAEIYMQVFEQEDDVDVRTTVLFSLAQLGDDVPADWFIDIINDESEDIEVRQQALHAATMMDIVDVDFLRQIYDSDVDEDLKEQVFFALAQTGDPEALDLILDIARTEDDPELREHAVFMLGQFKGIDDEKIAEFLLQIINEED